MEVLNVTLIAYCLEQQGKQDSFTNSLPECVPVPKLCPFDKLKPGEQTLVLVSLKVFTLYKILIAKVSTVQ